MLEKLKWQMHCGNAGEVLSSLKSKEPSLQIHCVVTSPPYFNKREYGDSSSELGRESNVLDYVKNLADVFDQIPLHPLGSVWVNIGDKRKKDKSLYRAPHLFCQEMESRGWLLIDEVIWAKVIVDDNGETDGGCMTEPANSRLNGNGFEPMYRFVKSNKAWSDTCAVRIPRQGVDPKRYLPKELMGVETCVEGRNLLNVWRVPMGQTSEKHYAVWSPALCERAIAMTCPMWVNEDGTLRTRIVEMEEYDEQRGSARVFGKYNAIESPEDIKKSGRMDTARQYVARKPVTKGWTPLSGNWSSGIVFDPFCGTGTTGEVALKLGRSFIGLDLYEECVRISSGRLEKTIGYLNEKQLNPFELSK